MPSINFATTQMNTGGSPGSLTPVLLSGNAGGNISGGPRIDPNAANVRTASMPVPKIQVDNTLQMAASAGMEMSQSAFKFQQREDSYFAEKLVLSYRQKVRDSFEGASDAEGNFKPGYNSSKGDASSSGYNEFQSLVEETRSQLLANASPSVKQKALLGMASVRNTYLTRAASHRSSQMKIADEELRYERRQDAVREMSTDPASMYTVDPISGLTGKDKFYMQFTTQKEADKAWYDLVSDTMETTYLKKGLDSAFGFYTDFAKTELVGSPGHESGTLASLQRWENDAIRTYNSDATLRLKQEAVAIKKTQNGNRDRLLGNQIKGVYASETVVGNMVKIGDLDAGVGRTYMNDVYSPKKTTTDPSKLRWWEDQLEKYADNNFVGPEGRNYSREYLADGENLDPSARQHLQAYETKLSSPSFKADYTRGKDEISTWLRGKFWEQGMYDQIHESQINDVNRELFNRLNNKEDFDVIMEDMRTKYNPVAIRYSKMLPLRTGVKPMNTDELLEQLTVAKELRAKGEYSDDDYILEQRRITEFSRAMEQQGMIQ